MSEEPKILVVHLDRAGSDSLAVELSRIPTVEARVAEKRNLDGSPAGWLVLVAVTIRTLPAILDAIGRLIHVHRVKAVTMGTLVVENPTRADVDKLINAQTEA